MESEKFLHRRRWTFSALCLFAWAAAPNWLVAQESDSSTPVTALDDFIASVATLTANFTQETWTADLELLDTSTGRFSLVRPNRFIWYYETPFEEWIVADGTTLWMYDVELAQITRTPLEIIRGDNLGMLLSGSNAVSDGFDTVEQFAIDDREWVRLIPKSPNSDFSSVLVAFRDGALDELEIVDGLNHTTRIAFSDVVINPSLDPSEFEFEPPEDTHVIGDLP